MSKTAKALAILGVVAGLGVSALPLSAYATITPITYWDKTGTGDATNVFDYAFVDSDSNGTYDGPLTAATGMTEEQFNALVQAAYNGKVAGDVLVKTTIDNVLSITIAGNDDDHTVDTAETASHVVLLSTDPATSLDGKIMNGGNGSGAATVTVATNNIRGYNVNLKGATTGLMGLLNTDGTTHVADDGKTQNSIPAMTSAKAAITTTSGDASEWGYEVTTDDTNFTAVASPIVAAKATGKKILSNYNPVSTTDAVIINSGDATENAGDTFKITFGVHASESQAADTYSNTITLTAIANNA